MPIFSYFVVMGTVLTGLLLWINHEIEPNSLPLFDTAPVTGAKKAFKPLPEPRYRITAFNFAAPYRLPATTQIEPAAEPVKIARSPRTKKMSPEDWMQLPRDRLAEYPTKVFRIH